jgi:phosphatidylglycerophosphatase A
MGKLITCRTHHFDIFDGNLKNTETQNLGRDVVRDPVHWLAFGFGAGLLPIAPGTWASFFTALVFWLIAPLPIIGLVFVIVLMFVAGVWICGESARRIGVHDHGGIVFDEIVGMLLTLTVVSHEAVWIAVAFLLFRIADVWKPWPIRDVDHRMAGGLGIMLDDVLAAFYAALVTFFMQRIFTVI